MMSPEMNRLVQEMQQPALQDTLGAALKQCGSAEAAAAILQRAGYAISVQELEDASAELSDQTLDQLDGGGLFSGWVRDLNSVWEVRRGG